MKSPFPGMDPYIENQQGWEDFHLRFLNYWCEAIAEALPQGYEARLDARVQMLEVETGTRRQVRPDVAVVRQDRSARGSGPSNEGAVATFEPVARELPVMEEVREAEIRILHRPERTLVAVLEVLSPTNKSGEGRGRYWAKRAALLAQPIHLVELDLLLRGERVPMAEPLPPGDYYAVVARSERRRQADVYAWTVRDRLPTIPVPLLQPDRDVLIDMEIVFATVYEHGRLAEAIDYTAELTVPLSEEVKVWAEGIGRAAARK